MTLEYKNANSILVNTFPDMERVYNDNIDEYVDLPYAFYEDEFVPFIMSMLHQNNLSALGKIFNFIESLFTDGDEMIVNLAGVAIVESLFFEKEYPEYREIIKELCGERTCKSFSDCMP